MDPDVRWNKNSSYQEAIAEFQKAITLSGGNPSAFAGLAHAYAYSGNAAEAEKVTEQLRVLSRRRDAPYEMAIAYTGLGNRAEALTLLEEAYRERNGWLWFNLGSALRSSSAGSAFRRFAG